ncbi:MAG: hypothetical protein ACE5E1_09030 [Phycisphaerae bacterium]
MIFYHRTDASAEILINGFRDGEGTYMTEIIHRGVWLSDRPLDANEGAYGDAVLQSTRIFRTVRMYRNGFKRTYDASKRIEIARSALTPERAAAAAERLG